MSRNDLRTPCTWLLDGKLMNRVGLRAENYYTPYLLDNSFFAQSLGKSESNFFCAASIFQGAFWILLRKLLLESTDLILGGSWTMFRWKRMTSQGESHLRSHMEETATWEGDYVEGPGRRGWLEHWAPKQGGALSKKSWNFVSFNREVPPWRTAVVSSKIVLKLIENCTWKREETNVLKVKSERRPAEKKSLKIAIVVITKRKLSFWWDIIQGVFY